MDKEGKYKPSMHHLPEQEKHSQITRCASAMQLCKQLYPSCRLNCIFVEGSGPWKDSRWGYRNRKEQQAPYPYRQVKTFQNVTI